MSNNNFGVIVMACYKPREDLLTQQLKSIQNQTHQNFKCILSSDGDPKLLEELVTKICKGDPRFEVIGFKTRLGFPGNFERGLKHLPEKTKWIALSDQDDYWYPEKLKTLIPYLSKYSLVSGQANVVTSDKSTMVGKKSDKTTDRAAVSARGLIMQNQITGSFSMLSPEVLDIALPIPKMNDQTVYHDQWLGLCAIALKGIHIVDIPLQNYVQHSNNFVGEAKNGPIIGFLNTMKKWKNKFPEANNFNLVRLGLHDLHNSGVGKNMFITKTLQKRLEVKNIEPNQQIRDLFDVYTATKNSKFIIAKAIINNVQNKETSKQRAVELLVGLPF
ncbi:MAG: glycosyltransferase [Micrococcaceae bacterium]